MKSSIISVEKTIVLTAVFFTTVYNLTFFSNVLRDYPLSLENAAFLFSLALLLTGVFIILLSLVCYRNTLKLVTTPLFLITALAAYFMDSYNVIIDVGMIRNMVMTDTNEVMDLLTVKMFGYFLLLGIAPALLVGRLSFANLSLKSAVIARLKLVIPVLAIIVATIFAFSSHYASFIREHKPLRYYTNPTGYIYAVSKYVNGLFESERESAKPIAEDARISAADTERELIIFVLGETARYDRFSVNGYGRETNPLLKRENIVSFNNVWSCGTSTADSVPCIFSVYGREDFSDAKAQSVENVLDILQNAGVSVLWRDNNSSSKGVAIRVPYESFKSADTNPVCDSECRDEGMLDGLQAFIDKHAAGDIFIVLHQMGNHGPAYYKRYPPAFEKFKPTCKTNQLEDCSKEEIDNAYDNAILYTDFFLAKVIELLKANSKKFETAMFYISDHGESLGEGGVYLHGLPYLLSPETQRHVPAILWFGENNNDVNISALRQIIGNKYSHDNLFHSILGLLEIETGVYRKEMDIVHAAE
ncbi:MAG: phosphoethanolamine--lipid A transferase [Gammaproteobacteria bacterium]|nr:phosphoethanolamine--lipid A transferase [Gammaproteobacteria bacterium]